jgi:hypothetical protein
MSEAKKIKATAEDLKTYEEFEKRMNSLDPVDNKREWDETAKAGNDFVDSRDWFTIVIEKDGKEGVMDLDGTVLVPPIFDKVAYTYSRIHVNANKPVVVVNNGKFGIVRADGTGEMVLPCEHDFIRLTDLLHFFLVIDNGKIMFVNNLGEQLTPQTVDAVRDELNEVFVLASGDKLGLYDFNNDLFIQPSYDNIDLGDGDEPVIAYKDGIAGYLSAIDGHFIPKEEYDISDDDEELI